MLVKLRHGARQWLVSGGYLLLVFVGAQIDAPLGWQACAAGIAVLALVAWLMTLRRARAIADTPTSAIASAAQGYVELLGKGLPLGGTPLMAPLRPMPCLWYRYRIERKQDNKWVAESSGESTDSFLIDDGSGQCLVDPEGAEILPRDTQTWIEGSYRYTQSTLVAGEPIYVLGGFRTLAGDALQLDADADIKFLLAEWKKDMPTLLKRFDLDGDGNLDMREWQLARSQAKREVAKNHRELRAAPHTHMMGPPEAGRLFLISSLPPEKLERYYLRWAIAHVLIFLAALAGFAWLRGQA